MKREARSAKVSGVKRSGGYDLRGLGKLKGV